MNNTQILEMALSTISCILLVALTYTIVKITLRLTLKKTREEIAMLYDLLDEHDDELKREAENAAKTKIAFDEGIGYEIEEVK